MCNDIRPCVLDLLKTLQNDESDCNGAKNDHVRKRRRTNSQGKSESKEKENEEDKPKNYTDDQVKDVLRCILLIFESYNLSVS